MARLNPEFNHLPDCKLTFAPMGECGCLHAIAVAYATKVHEQKRVIKDLAKELRYYTAVDGVDSLESIAKHLKQSKAVLKRAQEML